MVQRASSGRTWRYGLVAGLCLVGVAWPTSARSEIEFEWGGQIKSDLRIRVEEKSMGDWYDRYVLPVGISRNENIAKFTLDALAGDWAGVIDLDFVYIGMSDQVNTLGVLSDRNLVDPYRLEAHALYIEALDLFEGFDLRIGYQKLLWGVGDQFNPTNNMNADDVEDELLFGEQQANAMIRMDWTPHELFSITTALVPVFRPALLPPSGRLAVAATDRLPMADGPFRRRIAAQQNLTTANGYPTIVNEITLSPPDPALDNMQVGVQIATMLGEQDLSFSYFYGHHDIPVPVQNHTTQIHEEVCPSWWDELPADDPQRQTADSPCTKGFLATETTLEFPRMQVVGFNMAGEVDLLGWMSDAIHPIGYRIEAGVFFPEEKRLRLTQDELLLTMPDPFPPLPVFAGQQLPVPGGEYDYPGTVLDQAVAASGRPSDALAPVVLPETPFAKWSVGLDYSFGAHVYMNLQWIHGLADEFGAGDWITEGYSSRFSENTADEEEMFNCGLPRELEVGGVSVEVGGLGSGRTCVREILRPRLGDYVVLGLDFKFLNDAALLRLFTMWDVTGLVEEAWDETQGRRVQTYHHAFTDTAFSAVIYPSFAYNFGYGLTLTTGALIKLGKPWTKFGDPAAGGSIVWSSAKFAF